MELKKTNYLYHTLELNKIANSLFSQNKTLAILFMLTLSSISALTVYFPSWLILISASETLIATIFFCVICKKYGASITANKIIATCAIYLLIWLLTYLHLFLIKFNVDQISLILVIIITMSALFYLLGYYFFFVKYLFHNCSLADSFTKLDSLIPYPRTLAIKILGTAIIVSLTYQQFFLFFLNSNFYNFGYPILLEILACFASGIKWAIITFMSLAVALKNISVKTEPSYLFATQGVGKYIIVLLALGLISAYFSIASKPTFNIELIKQTYSKESKELVLEIKVYDKNNGLSNLQPIFFRIAGEEGFALSGTPISINPEEEIIAMKKGKNEVNLTIAFKIINRADDFEQLKDKSLWYVNHKIIGLGK